MIFPGDRPESRSGILFQALEGISMAEKIIGVGIIGSGLVADIHAASFAQVQGARLAAVASSRLENAAAFYGGPWPASDFRLIGSEDDR